MAVAIALFCLAIFVYACYTYLKPRRMIKLPPGPRGIPIFGNAFQFTRERFMLDIADVGKEYGDAFTIKLFNEETVVLNSYDMMKESLSSPQYAHLMNGRPPTFVGTYILKNDEIFANYSEEWSALRKLAMRGLKTYGTHLADVEELVQEELKHLIERITKEAGKPVDPVVYISGYITSIISMLITGKYLKYDDEQLRLMAKITDTVSFLLGTKTAQILHTMPWLRHIPIGYGRIYHELQQDMFLFKKKAFQERRKATEENHGRRCFLDFIIEEIDKGAISEESAVGVMMDLLLAGTATSTATLKTMFLILTARPDVQKKIQEEIGKVVGTSRLPCSSDKNEMHYTQAVLWEILRLYTTAPLTLPHCTMEDVNIRDYCIPKDTLMFLNLWHVLHDEKFWNDPWEFNPSRFLDNTGRLVPPEDERRQRMITFGIGKRACIGEVLARLRLFLASAAVLQNFDLVPDPTKPLPNIDPRTFEVDSLLNAPTYTVIFRPRLSK